MSKSAVAGLVSSATGLVAMLALLINTSITLENLFGKLVVAVVFLCPIVGTALSFLARRDIKKAGGALRGGRCAFAGAVVGLLGLLLLAMLVI